MELNPALNDLNIKQREAVLSEHPRLLVLAGAGSGKTKTLIQKIMYLISEKNVDPSNILAITFAKNAANEMIDRLIIVSDKEGEYEKILSSKNIAQIVKDDKRREYIKKYPWLKNITVKTFHGLCYHILRNYGAKEYDNKFKILADYLPEDSDWQRARETPEQIIHKIILKQCEDLEYLLKLKRYILDYYVDEFRVKMHKLGRADYRNPYTTLKGDHVKSKAERDIADWLYRHQIEYEYEPKTTLVSFECKPDFYIKEANLYLELVSNISYSLKNKEREMKEAGKTYVKIYESETCDSNEFNRCMDNTIVSHLDRDLKKVSTLNISEEFKGYDQYLRQFILDTIRVIDKIKVEDRNLNEIYGKAINDQHNRVREFYEFLKPLFLEYRDYCIRHSYLDFDDLLIETILLFKNQEEIRKLFQNKFKYVLVDEFQDVNTLQVILLNHLLKDGYLFSWNDVPGNDSGQLLKFLKDDLKIEWVENAKIEKSDDGKAITITKENNSLIFKLNKEKSKISLEITGGGSHEYRLEEEKGKLNIKDDNQLFCVGDDWQSIYGFRGSEIEYIVNFEKYFENPEIVKLDVNYRSNETIVNVSNKVISHNKYKIDKEVRSFSKSGKKIYLYCAKKETEDGVEVVVENIKKLLKSGYDKTDILVLTRTTKSDAYAVYSRKLGGLGINIVTIHQAKGLESKVVFITGLVQGYMGFPNVRDADRIFQMIKESNFELLMEEERRLFYVALTRAKEELFLISEVGNESEFIKEIPGEFLDRNNFLILALKSRQQNCKHCGEGIEDSFNYCPYCGVKCCLEDLNGEETATLNITDDEIRFVENVVRDLCLNSVNKIANIKEITEKADEIMLDKRKLNKILDELRDKSIILEPVKNYWKLVKK